MFATFMIEDILHERGREAVDSIRANLTPINATSKTSNSVSYRVFKQGDKTTLQVVGTRPFFATVETGSKPSDKNPSPEMIQVRDVPKDKVWGVAKTILKKGSKLWREGGRKDIYSNVREETIKNVMDDIKKTMKERFSGAMSNFKSV